MISRLSARKIHWRIDSLADPWVDIGVSLGAALSAAFQGSAVMNKGKLGVAILTAAVFAAGPASAAQTRASDCSGPSQAKVEAMVEGMAYSPNRIMAQEEIALAQTDLLNGRMAGCAVHLTRATNDATMRGIPSGSMRPDLPPPPTAPVKPGT